jgi:hypothetical protein
MFHQLRRSLLRLLTFARSTRAEQELSREVSSHLQLLEDDFIARGMSVAGLAARSNKSRNASATSGPSGCWISRGWT